MFLNFFFVLKSRAIAIISLTILCIIALSILISSGIKDALAMNELLPITGFNAQNREICITVNVYEFTDVEGIVKALDGRKATFFISEEYQYSQPDKVRTLSEKGFDTGILLSSMQGMSESEINNTLAYRIEGMAKIIGENTYMVRFNHNRYDKNSLQAVYAVNLIPVQWSADDTDENYSPGDIILMSGEVNTKRFIEKVQADNMAFVTVSEVT